MRFWKGSSLASAIALAPGQVFAHTGEGHVDGLFHGLTHPLFGIDHLLAMILVGMIAYRIGGRALIMVPAAFIGVMIAGGVLGAAQVELPFVEVGVALSVVMLGAAIALSIPLSATVAAVLVGTFAVAHGHAHGTEVPSAASAVDYGLGFVLATALIHVAGIGLGRAADSVAPSSRLLARTFGGAATVAGLGFLLGVV
jgi:urease accessory protein